MKNKRVKITRKTSGIAAVITARSIVICSMGYNRNIKSVTARLRSAISVWITEACVGRVFVQWYRRQGEWIKGLRGVGWVSVWVHGIQRISMIVGVRGSPYGPCIIVVHRICSFGYCPTHTS